jgi:alpha-L-fucosidase
MIHQIRPDIIINNRCGLPGDYNTPEQHIGDFNLERDWESNMTFTGFWAWHGYQTKVISYEECLHRLVQCAGGNGNLLMNIGPMPTGEIDTREADRLRRVGEWLKVNGSSIYGTTGGPLKPNENFATTRKGKTVFVHVMKWPDHDSIVVPKIAATLKSSRLLNGGNLKLEPSAEGFRISVAPEHQTVGATVIALEFNEDVTNL